MTTHAAHSTWPYAGVMLWATSLGLLASAMLAPVRPWGWAGGTTLILALVMSVGAARANAGAPRRRQWAWVIAGATLFTTCVRWLLPTLLP